MSNVKDLQLITSVDLGYSPTSKPAYHFIYGASLYGTMFAIYAKFDGKEIPDGSPSAFQIEKIIFKLVNYKGCINIGFTTHNIDCEYKDDDKHYRINFGVQGASTLVDKAFDVKIQNTNEPLLVRKGQRVRVIFVRTLFPLPHYDGYLDRRYEMPIPQDPLALAEEPPVTPLFDTEFNYRDGAYLWHQPFKPGLFDPSHPAVGYRCNESEVNLLYF
jgi:hypothetical protein